MLPACNPSIWEVEAGRNPKVKVSLEREIQFQKKKCGDPRTLDTKVRGLL